MAGALSLLLLVVSFQLEAMEYLHEREYVHADIKGSNLLTGFAEGSQHKVGIVTKYFALYFTLLYDAVPPSYLQVYLVDYGLAYRFNPDGRHKKYQEDPRRQHDGTIEFTSIDAHKGVSESSCLLVSETLAMDSCLLPLGPSRRGDLEILGYCLLQWACGRLPWEDNLENKPYVATQKVRWRMKLL